LTEASLLDLFRCSGNAGRYASRAFCDTLLAPAITLYGIAKRPFDRSPISAIETAESGEKGRQRHGG
jgi:hypothetical protein